MCGRKIPQQHRYHLHHLRDHLWLSRRKSLFHEEDESSVDVCMTLSDFFPFCIDTVNRPYLATLLNWILLSTFHRTDDCRKSMKSILAHSNTYIDMKSHFER